MAWPYQGLPMLPQHDNPDQGEEYEFDWDAFLSGTLDDDEPDEDEDSLI